MSQMLRRKTNRKSKNKGPIEKDFDFQKFKEQTIKELSRFKNKKTITNISIDNDYEKRYKQYISEGFTNSTLMIITRMFSESTTLPKELRNHLPLHKIFSNISKQLLMNELEIIYFSLYLDKFGWQHDDYNISELFIVTGLSIKKYLNEHTNFIDNFLQAEYENIFEKFNRWLNIDKDYNHIMTISPREVNTRYLLLKRPYNSYCKNNFIDYNESVDRILHMSLPYGDGTKFCNEKVLQLFNGANGHLNGNSNSTNNEINNNKLRNDIEDNDIKGKGRGNRSNSNNYIKKEKSKEKKTKERKRKIIDKGNKTQIKQTKNSNSINSNKASFTIIKSNDDNQLNLMRDNQMNNHLITSSSLLNKPPIIPTNILIQRHDSMMELSREESNNMLQRNQSHKSMTNINTNIPKQLHLNDPSNLVNIAKAAQEYTTEIIRQNSAKVLAQQQQTIASTMNYNPLYNYSSANFNPYNTEFMKQPSDLVLNGDPIFFGRNISGFEPNILRFNSTQCLNDPEGIEPFFKPLERENQSYGSLNGECNPFNTFNKIPTKEEDHSKPKENNIPLNITNKPLQPQFSLATPYNLQSNTSLLNNQRLSNNTGNTQNLLNAYRVLSNEKNK